MVLKIHNYGDPVLRKKGERVVNFDSSLDQFAKDLIETIRVVDAAGLAAQQVGVDLAICVIDPSRATLGNCIYDGKEIPTELILPLSIVNPCEIEFGSQKCVYSEGCMSIPGNIWGDVERPESISLKFQDLTGAWHTIRANGALARVIQHELDHLEGILFIDRMDRRDLMRLENKLKKLRRETQAHLKQKDKGAHVK
jgi:peptide deformylase